MMGVFPKSSSCACDTPATPKPPITKPEGNPDPSHFKVLWTAEYHGWLVAGVWYPDAKNYEGTKVLVYRRTTAADLHMRSVLDPHFCERGHLSPFARFEPTEEGIAAAKRLCEVLGG